jgi:hypothetical protein
LYFIPPFLCPPPHTGLSLKMAHHIVCCPRNDHTLIDWVPAARTLARTAAPVPDAPGTESVGDPDGPVRHGAQKIGWDGKPAGQLSRHNRQHGRTCGVVRQIGEHGKRNTPAAWILYQAVL